MRAFVPALAVLTLAVGLVGCAEPTSGPGAAATSAAGTSTAPDSAAATRHELVLVLDRAEGAEPERYTLSCTPAPEGDHPAAAAACAHLAGLSEPFAPLPADAVCTEQYGGPQTARITGRWQDRAVDLELSRTDGCRIAQWESLGPLVPPVDGVGAD